MKKLYSMALALVLAFSITACGSVKDSGNDDAGEMAVETMEQKAAETKQTENEKSSEELKSEPVDVPDDAAKAAAEEASKEEASKEDAAKAEASKEESSKEEASKEDTSKVEGSEQKRTDSAKDDSTEGSKEENVKTSDAAENAPAKNGYGRILFVGDSRTVDMFSAEVDRIAGDVYDGITVYAHDGDQYDEMVADVNNAGIDSFDTLVSWMGCNDFGKFGEYGSYYEQLMSQGKNVVVCTVGPTVDECLLDDMDWFYYPNENQKKYNNSLVAWANSKGVRVIDLYSFISNSTTITVVPTDGIHYLPQPTTELWSEIKKYIK